jgi:hypothetical protein
MVQRIHVVYVEGMRLAPLVPKPKPTPQARSSVRRKPTASCSARAFGGVPLIDPQSGSAWEGRAIAGWGIMPKLEVGAVNDPLEREADAVADRVMRTPAPRVQSHDLGSEPQHEGEAEVEAEVDAEDDLTEAPMVGGFAGAAAPPRDQTFVRRSECSSCEDEDSIHRTVDDEDELRRKCSTCEDEDEIRRACASCDAEDEIRRACASCERDEEDDLRRSWSPRRRDDERAAGRRGGSTSNEFAARVWSRARSGGVPLPRNARSFLEPRLGVDLDYVRVHADAAAGRLARQINARAFTLGADLFFAPGEWRPQTSSGMRLLAHEVAHTLQGSGSMGRLASRRYATKLMPKLEVGEPLEGVADAVAAQVPAPPSLSPDQANHLQGSKELAAKMVKSAASKLQAIDPDKPPQGFIGLFEEFFGSYSPGNLRLVRVNILQIQAAVGQIGQEIDPQFDPDCSGVGDGRAYFATSDLANYRIGTRVPLYLCPEFFGTDEKRSAMTLLHELTHFVLRPFQPTSNSQPQVQQEDANPSPYADESYGYQDSLDLVPYLPSVARNDSVILSNFITAYDGIDNESSYEDVMPLIGGVVPSLRGFDDEQKLLLRTALASNLRVGMNSLVANLAKTHERLVAVSTAIAGLTAQDLVVSTALGLDQLHIERLERVKLLLDDSSYHGVDFSQFDQQKTVVDQIPEINKAVGNDLKLPERAATFVEHLRWTLTAMLGDARDLLVDFAVTENQGEMVRGSLTILRNSDPAATGVTFVAPGEFSVADDVLRRLPVNKTDLLGSAPAAGSILFEELIAATGKVTNPALWIPVLEFHAQE